MIPVAIICAIAAIEAAVGIYFYRCDGEKRTKGIEATADRDARLDGPLNLPAPREDLAEVESWPVRQTPTDLIAAYEANWPWRLPLVSGVIVDQKRYERLGVYRIVPLEEILRPKAEPATAEYRIQFDAIISSAFADGWKCDSCAVGRDGEDQHVSCPGCACHCGDNQGAQVVHIGEPGRNAWMGEVAA